MANQQTFEWDWPATRRVSRALRFPDFLTVPEGNSIKRVAASVVRAVMMAIEDHAGVSAWSTVSNQTLFAEASVRPTHGKRALRFLDLEGFLIRATRYQDGVRIRSMRPNWQQYLDHPCSSLTVSAKNELLRELGGPEDPDCRPKVPERKAEVPERRPKVPERKAEVPLGGPKSRSISLERNLRPIDRCAVRDDRVIGFKFSEQQLAFAEDLVGRITSAVDMTPKGKFTQRQNWEAAAKLAVMTAARAIPESYLAMGIETIRNGGKSVALPYLIAVVRNRCREDGEDFGRLMKSAVLPSQLRWLEEDDNHMYPMEVAR